MGTYKLSEAAQSDLVRIHQRGVRLYGEKQADQYFFDLIKRFEQLAEQPLMYAAVDDIRPGYRRSVCGGVDSIYYRINGDIVEIMAILGQQDIDEWL